MEGDDLRFLRSTRSILQDPKSARLDSIQTDLILLHARRATKPHSVREANTHPFLAERHDRFWAFCHNGTVEDRRHLEALEGASLAGRTDSEVLFHHILGRIDPEDPERSLLASVAKIDDYTSLHSFLANDRWILALAKRHPRKGLKEYHALWEGLGPDIHVVSSEPVDGIGCDRWTRMPEPGTVLLRRDGR